MTTIRTPEENKKLIEAEMHSYRNLQNDLIRTQANVDRYQVEVNEAAEHVRNAFNTTDPEETKKIAETQNQEATAATDLFLQKLAEIKEKMKKFDSDDTRVRQQIPTRNFNRG